VVRNVLEEPAASFYTVEYVSSRFLWNIVHDTQDKTLPQPRSLYGIMYAAVCCVQWFLFCFFSFVVGVVRLKRSLISQETYKFVANHPFIFFIHERRTDLTLFIGRYMNPTAVVVRHSELWLCICFELVSILGWGGSCLQCKCWSL
jgi:hypothetical protein